MKELIISMFIEFMRNNKALEAWEKNCITIGKNKPMELLNSTEEDDFDRIISMSFTWANTIEGRHWWNKLSDKWGNTFCKYYYGDLRR